MEFIFEYGYGTFKRNIAESRNLSSQNQSYPIESQI
jgi:hypothetical protein